MYYTLRHGDMLYTQCPGGPLCMVRREEAYPVCKITRGHDSLSDSELHTADIIHTDRYSVKKFPLYSWIFWMWNSIQVTGWRYLGPGVLVYGIVVNNMCEVNIIFRDMTQVIGKWWLGPEIISLEILGLLSCVLDTSCSAYTKNTGHDMWTLDTDPGHWALVTNPLLAPKVG